MLVLFGQLESIPTSFFRIFLSRVGFYQKPLLERNFIECGQGRTGGRRNLKKSQQFLVLKR